MVPLMRTDKPRKPAFRDRSSTKHFSTLQKKLPLCCHITYGRSGSWDGTNVKWLKHDRDQSDRMTISHMRRCSVDDCDDDS